ncbi:mitotic checkpoint serine/threonine-protein kinase BUB1 [Euwallacea fornicatus]|uniref:mitotic checkpoint serine/threonine-protein kinase BUB1 n=1 Tax=Euwallacea fornicatus TaxID=995702 RepID=UPI00338D9B74
MDFDLSKENIQPLRRGRNVHQLEMALQAQTNPEYQMQLQQQKEQFEALIGNYQGDDPLENYYEYITWIEQAYPKNGHEGNCVALLEHCLKKFEDDSRYTNDIRFCKLWIKYIDMFPNPAELYLMMKSKNLCSGLADFYKAWAYYYEAAGDFQKAKGVFEEGKKNLAQPYEELESAYSNLITATGEHVLFGPNENRLHEKRQALTSLHSFRGRVNSVRVPSGVSNGMSTFSHANPSQNSNYQLKVHEDQVAASLIGGAAPMSIITVAKLQEAPKENALKAGPWATVPNKKRVLSNHRHVSSAFSVLEDDDKKCLPVNFRSTSLENFSDWKVTLMNCPDPPSPTVVFGYPKDKVYANAPDMEFSLEEIRARRYQKIASSAEQGEPCQVDPPIYIEDEDDECIIVMQESPPMEIAEQETNEVFPALNQSQHLQCVQQLSPVGTVQSFQPETTSTVSHSPWKSAAEHQNFLQDLFSKTNERRLSALPPPKLKIFEDPETVASSSFLLDFSPDPQPQNSNVFAVFEQSDQEVQAPKGKAMKTAFRTLNADEVETGSRGGMDGAMAAQPADGARAMAPIPFSDSSSSSYEDVDAEFDTSCTTQQFNFNLNAMKVSTPQNKHYMMNVASEQDLQNSRKALFSDRKLEEKRLSIILEEKSGYVSTSSSSGAATKSSLYKQHNKIGTISEEHSSYLEQNMKANAELRRSLLGNLMEDVLPSHMAPVALPPASPMQSTPAQSPVRKIPPPNVTRPLDYVPSDPFNANLISKLLDRVSFPGVHHQGYIQIDGNPRLTTKKESVFIGRDSYTIDKLLGKGQFGTVFKAYSHQMSCTVALKYQKPPNRWEFYICRELQARLANHPLRDRFMDVTVGYFSDQASILVSHFEPYGTLLDTANALKYETLKMKETVSLYFTVQMMQIVKAMHEVKIIHADIKPDNFLVLLLPNNELGLQLIDFGCSIDMTMFPDKAAFTRPINTEDFICCEVRDGRPWSYHTDIYCVAASAHVLLCQEYIQVRKNRDGIWGTTSRLPRGANAQLWNGMFNNFLNQQTGPADIATLELLFHEELDYRKKEIHLQLSSLINKLKNR